jgi:hypothetical protein
MARLAPARQSADAPRLHPHRRQRRQEISRPSRISKTATIVKDARCGLGKA